MFLSLGLFAAFIVADENPGYLYTTYGDIVRTAYGHCVHTAYFALADGVAECGESQSATDVYSGG